MYYENSHSNTPNCHAGGSRRMRMFVKGPIPLTWLEQAAGLGGRVLTVGIAIWFLAGLKKSNTVILQPKVLRQFHVSRGAAYECLKRLEHAGLISVDRHRGRAPVVTILKSAVQQAVISR